MKGPYGFNVRVVGKCGRCGGRVVLPRVWMSVEPPVPTCEDCGAQVDQTAHLPTLPMKPTSAKWRARMMKETEGMTKPGDVLAHLAADAENNGPPPKHEEDGA